MHFKAPIPDGYLLEKCVARYSTIKIEKCCPTNPGIDKWGIFNYNFTYEYLLICLFYKMKKEEIAILDEHTAAHVAELFRAFSDTSRVRLLSALIDTEHNVGALAALVGISESAVSHHLRGLRLMNIVKARRDGKEVYYRIEDEHIIDLFQQGVSHVQDE